MSKKIKKQSPSLNKNREWAPKSVEIRAKMHLYINSSMKSEEPVLPVEMFTSPKRGDSVWRGNLLLLQAS